MEDIDVDIRPLTELKQVFNSKLFDYLCEEYHDIYKRLEYKGSIKLILIRSPILFSLLEIKPDEGCLELKSIRKNEEYKIYDEEAFISDVINKILHWLWINLASEESN